jgi:predicted ABC-type ATPase
MANLYIISGCNGAGKTTASYTILPEMLSCKEFVNADEIARGLSPFKPESVSIQAGRIMVERIKNLISNGTDFALETTLATRTHAKVIRYAQANGYKVTLVFFWLNLPSLAIERVKMRVASGGHNIEEKTIRRRYDIGIKNLFSLYIPLCEYWMIINNSSIPQELIAEGGSNLETKIYNKTTYNKIANYERIRD